MAVASAAWPISTEGFLSTQLTCKIKTILCFLSAVILSPCYKITSENWILGHGKKLPNILQYLEYSMYFLISNKQWKAILAKDFQEALQLGKAYFDVRFWKIRFTLINCRFARQSNLESICLENFCGFCGSFCQQDKYQHSVQYCDRKALNGVLHT